MTLRLLRLSFRNAPGSRATLALPAIAFAIVTALVIVVIGGAQSFFRWDDPDAINYQLMAAIALTLLLVPMMTLGGAAARLSARRRDDRLATLRLLGATADTVLRLTVLESAIVALCGALGGVVLSRLILPLISLIHFRGTALGLAGVIPPWWGFVLIVAGIVAIAVLSSLLSLRAVVVSPLGVRTRQDAPRISAVRVLIAAAVVIVAFVAINLATGMSEVLLVFAAIIGGFAATMGILNLIGPWVLHRIALRGARRAKNPLRLIAARRVAEDPKAAWRQVSGIAMTSFMAVAVGSGLSLIASIPDANADGAAATLIGDIATGLLITVVGSFLIVACGVGVAQAADVLDRRELSKSLIMLGTPETLLDRVRRRAVLSPLLIVSLGSAAIAGILLFPVVGMSLIFTPWTALILAIVIGGGVILVLLAVGTTRPLQRAAVAMV
ncbi:FtsX-like permease family protein [Microbacterium gorillae]|uniref:FtsX-like permease family protein n=1 Tax=Microbacterium gorillae TaxID=1231063 RepID=UPI000590D111|nr:FtsX-like permease family protein [Microbacterium gorillae]